ncbi:MAG: DUF3068 domain-containing protein [Thermobispora bispora]|nr:DUF3068 domain-containing protein [Thermobispora bispora]
MRRGVGLVLLAIGAFLVVLAPLLRFPVAGRLVQAPSDQYNIIKLTAENAQYFSIADLKVLNANLDVTVTVRGDVSQAKDDHVVWDQFQATNDVTNNRPGIDFFEFRSAFNKYDGTGVTCCGVNVNKTPVTIEGQVFLFPFGVEKKTYKVFNPVTKQAYDAEFAGEEVIEGLDVYKFRVKVPPTVTETLTAPASVLGMDEPGDIQVSRVYEATITYWVDPITGLPVKQQQERREMLRTADGVDRMPALIGTFTYTPDTVRDLVSTARSNADQIRLITTTLPLTSLILGLIALIAGFVFLRGASRDAR